MEKQNEIKIFEEQKVRTVWDAELEQWYFSIIDVIEILTASMVRVSRTTFPEPVRETRTAADAPVRRGGN